MSDDRTYLAGRVDRYRGNRSDGYLGDYSAFRIPAAEAELGAGRPLVPASGEGKVFHDSIAAAEPYRHELALGWIGHYVVGILYGVILVLIMGPDWMRSPTFLPAWILGIVTIGAGWFLMQPGMGLGWAASKTPNPSKVRLMNFLTHTVFALGMYGTALLIG